MRSDMVAPGSSPAPAVITRVGMPSVWLSTAEKSLRPASGPRRRYRATAGALRGRRSAGSGSRGSRTGPPYRPASSWAILIAWTNRGSASQRSGGSSVR